MTALLRFAPSPTGALHLGGLRTALINHLVARKLGGKWLLRIEDTDASRAVPGSVDGIRAGLQWAGLDYDYGPERPGPHGTLFQSERLDLYHTHAHQLLESGHAYRCFCSADRLAETREALARRGSNATYDKACLSLTEEEVARRVRAGEKHVIRFNDGTPPRRETPDDLVFGRVRDAHASLPTDPVIIKSDRFPTYHLASVVDDHTMGVSHVLRGEEWLASLPLHLDLYASLGFEPPRFAHLPLLLNRDGTKMSKRKGDVQVAEFIRRGWESDALLNWLALAGWGVDSEAQAKLAAEGGTSADVHQRTAPDSTAIMSLSEMIEKFDLPALTHRRAVLDPAKLKHINQQHLARAWKTPDGLAALARRVHVAVKEAFPNSSYTTEEYISRVILALQGRLTNILELPQLAPFFFVDPDLSTEEAYEMHRAVGPEAYVDSLTTILSHIKKAEPSSLADAEAWRGLIHTAQMEVKPRVPSKGFMTALRHALSGMKTGPGVPDIIQVIGRDRAIARLQAARETPVHTRSEAAEVVGSA